MKPLTRAKVNEAIGLMSEGFSTRETAGMLGISPAFAGRVYSSNKENMPVNRGGRPRKISTDTVEFLKVNMKRGVLKTAIEATKRANELLPQPVSFSTIRRRLRDARLMAKRIVKRPALRREHIRGRLHFVRKYREWTEKDWAKVVWSDECKINRICSDGHRWVWDDALGPITTRSVQGTVKFGGGNVIVWGGWAWIYR